MTEIVDFQSKKRQMAARRGFKTWTSRFTEHFDETTRFQDVSDPVLGMLIQGGELASLPLYDLVMGIQGLGSGLQFHNLEMSKKMVVMDIAMFLLDQFRFEAMRRLGWVQEAPWLATPIFEAVEQYSIRFASSRHQAPKLSASHPHFSDYESAFETDRHAVVRRLIPEAIEAFEQKIGKKPDR